MSVQHGGKISGNVPGLPSVSPLSSPKQTPAPRPTGRTQAPGAGDELADVEFGTLYYGCSGEMRCHLFNDGPEFAPFMVTLELERNRLASAETPGTSGGQDEDRAFEVIRVPARSRRRSTRVPRRTSADAEGLLWPGGRWPQ